MSATCKASSKLGLMLPHRFGRFTKAGGPMCGSKITPHHANSICATHLGQTSHKGQGPRTYPSCDLSLLRGLYVIPLPALRYIEHRYQAGSRGGSCTTDRECISFGWAKRILSHSRHSSPNMELPPTTYMYGLSEDLRPVYCESAYLRSRF